MYWPKARLVTAAGIALFASSAVPASANSGEAAPSGGAANCDGNSEWVSQNGADAFSSIDPTGRTSAFDPAESSGTFIWCNGTAWHLRTTDFLDTTARYSGTIQVSNGSFLNVHSMRLEPDDPWQLTNVSTLSYQFLTWWAVDGLDFRVSDSATSITFTLTLKGVAQPASSIYIGDENAHPLSNTITFVHQNGHAGSGSSGSTAGGGAGRSAGNVQHVSGLKQQEPDAMSVRTFGVFHQHHNRR